MKPNIERAGEAQKSDSLDGQYAISLSDVLLACLAGNQTSVDDLHVLAQTCDSPYALVMLKPASHRGFVHVQSIVDLAISMRIRSIEAQLENEIVMLLASEDSSCLAEAVEEKGMAGKVAMAISLPFASLSAISLQYELLSYCFDSIQDAGIVKAENKAFSFLTSQISSAIETESLLHPAIAKLAHYDQMNQSNLLNTLKVYLDHDRNAQRCANLLYLHRNSLQYRVRRIQEIANVDLDDPEERAYLRLSFMLCN
ncbi:MAG: helix-turn-helix domain-containing protein [Eggerthellaceae bacterium]|nr:helix-turn-helix domain-containing protein [Eggerthellaceae bacterium]